jgi:hypothetical protein
MVATLESIVEKFGEEMAPYAVGLTQHLTAAFWRILDNDDKVSGGLLTAKQNRGTCKVIGVQHNTFADVLHCPSAALLGGGHYRTPLVKSVPTHPSCHPVVPCACLIT